MILAESTGKKYTKMLHLHILRHAKTESNDGSKKDFDRKLVTKGENQTKEMAAFFETHLPACTTFCSTARRTRQTAKLLQENSAIVAEKIGKIEFSDALYLASKDQLFQFLTSQGNQENILLIGHNEGISDLVSYLSGEFTSLSTCEYTCLSFACESWSEVSFETGKITNRSRPTLAQ